MSEVKTDSVVNVSGDNDSGIDLSTNDVVAIKTANTERLRVDSSGDIIAKTADARIGSDTGSVEYGTSTANSVRFYTSDTERMRVTSDGKVQVNGNHTLIHSNNSRFQVNVNGGNGSTAFIGVACNGSNLGNQAAGYYLGRANNYIQTTVDGNANFRDDIQVVAGASGGVTLSSGGTSWTGASDENVKTIIENIIGALDDVATLRTVIGRYDWDADDRRRSFLIAQDVQAVLPEVVETNPEGTLMLDYTGVIPLLTAALKEAKTKIETLETEMTALKARVTALENA